MNSVKPFFLCGRKSVRVPLEKAVERRVGRDQCRLEHGDGLLYVAKRNRVWLAWKCFGKRVTIARSALQLLGYMRFG